MEYPQPRTINSPKRAQKLCFCCKSEITDNPIEKIDVYSRIPGRKNYFHPACAAKFEIEKIVYNIIKEARKDVQSD